ncbi:MAG TPA: GDSL-type esterase/lipase family protein [Gemmataceae bacterium]|jgi:lysophospholipase L1-like esterase
MRFFSLVRSLLNWLWRRDRAKKPPPPRSREGRPSPLRVEALEDRRMMSANTTAPTPNNSFPFVGLGDMLMASQPKTPANIVFLGDSIDWGYQYGAGAPVWSAVMAGTATVDYGVIGQTTQNLLFQLSLGQLVGIHPSVIVLTIGTNNLSEGDTPQATAAGILADLNNIHLFAPQAQVLVLGVPPGGASPNDPYRIAVDQTNALVSQQLTGDAHATFFNIAPAFEQGDGSISNLVLFDYIHPTTLGYADMTVALLPAIAQANLGSFPLRAAQ